MNGTLAQARIYNGYRIAAGKVGQAYAQYRAASPITPIAVGNLLGNIDCVFVPTSEFTAPHKFKIPARMMFADGSVVAQRDILVGPYGTFYVGDLQPLVPLQVLKCNESISITRLTYAGTTQVLTPVATALPAFSQLKREDQKSVTGVGGASNASTALSEFYLFLPIAPGIVRQGDIIKNQAGVSYTLDTIDNAEIGVVVTMHQAESI